MDKKCSRCLLQKPLDQFYRLARAKDGLRSECKSCSYRDHKNYALTHPEVMDRARKKWALLNPGKRKPRIRTQVRIAYEREYRKKNRNKLAAYMRGRRIAHRFANPLKRLSEEEKKARRKASRAKWYQSNKAKHRADDRKWRDKNKLKIAKYSKQYSQSNPEIGRKAKAKYAAAHRAYYGAKTMERNARKKKAVAPWANKFFIEEIYDLARRRSALKSGGYAKWHVDHIVPLQHPKVCGFHVEHNLRVIPSVQNYAKGNRTWPHMP